MVAPETTGRVVMVSGEDEINHIHSRLRALRTMLASDPTTEGRDALAQYDSGIDHLDLYDLADDLDLSDALSVLADADSDPSGLSIMEAGRQDARPRIARKAVQELLDIAEGARLLVLDPLVSFHAVGENDNGHMHRLAKLFIWISRQFGGATITVHHTGNDGATTSRDDHQAGRGASSFASAARAVWTIRRLSPQEQQAAEGEKRNPRRMRYLRGPKISRGEEQDGVFLNIGVKGMLTLATPISLSKRDHRRGGGARRATADAYARVSGSSGWQGDPSVLKEFGL